jgi:hypothetical protein
VTGSGAPSSRASGNRLSISAAGWGAALLYLGFAALLPWSKPGLHYDEGLVVRDAVQILFGAGPPPFAHEARSWIHFRRFWLPLMDLPYLGPIKGYAMVLPFALFGTGAAVCRAGAVAFTAFGILGIARTVAREVSPGAGLAAGALIAVHPAVLDQTVYDNNVVAVWIASMGALGLAFSLFRRSRSSGAALLLGLAAGIGIWGRLNFVWLLAAAAASAAVVAPRAAKDAIRAAGPIAAGSFAGMVPVLFYELRTHGGTFHFMSRAGARIGPAARLLNRLPLLAESLLSDGEHRAIWGGPRVPTWQVALTVTLVAAGAACALFPPKGGSETAGAAAWRRASALTLVLFTATMLLSRMNVTEHHLVTAVPVAAVAAALGFRRVGLGSRIARPAIAAAAALFVVVAVSWNVRAAEGLRATGGRGDWSDAIEDVAATLRTEAPGDAARALRWGLANNVFVLTRGAVRMREVFWRATEAGPVGGSWTDEIRSGGFFLSGRKSSPAEEGFRKALLASGLPYRKWTFRQSDGTLYAELFRILPAPPAPSAPTPSP